MASADSKDKLIALLKANRVHDAVTEYMVDTIGMESMSDFASFFTEKTYAEGCYSKIVEHTAYKDNDLQVGRVRTAWRLAEAELKKATEAVVKGNVQLNDWDVPLADDQELQRKTDFDAAYPALEFDSESTPAPQLVGRSFREFHDPKRQLTLLALVKMRSVADFQNLPTNVKKNLSEDIEITLLDQPRLPDLSFKTVVQLLWAMKIMSNLWIMTGAEKVESKESPGKRVCQIPMTAATSYADFFMRKAMEHPGPMRLTIRWLIQRDRQTRAKARQLYAAGYPYGEALIRARDIDCQVLWTCGAPGIAGAQVPVVSAAEGDDVDMSDEVYVPPKKKARRKRKRGGGLSEQPPLKQQRQQQQGGQPWRQRMWQNANRGGSSGSSGPNAGGGGGGFGGKVNVGR